MCIIGNPHAGQFLEKTVLCFPVPSKDGEFTSGNVVNFNNKNQT